MSAFIANIWGWKQRSVNYDRLLLKVDYHGSNTWSRSLYNCSSLQWINSSYNVGFLKKSYQIEDSNFLSELFSRAGKSLELSPELLPLIIIKLVVLWSDSSVLYPKCLGNADLKIHGINIFKWLHSHIIQRRMKLQDIAHTCFCMAAKHAYTWEHQRSPNLNFNLKMPNLIWNQLQQTIDSAFRDSQGRPGPNKNVKSGLLIIRENQNKFKPMMYVWLKKRCYSRKEHG